MLALFREQPRAFYMIFMLEMWERFGYYAAQGILILYFIRFLGFDDSQAYYTFGAFSALVYGMVAVGGYLGDKVLGIKRTIVLGIITLALGYLTLAFADKTQVFLALGLVCVGNGLFKANPANLLAKCYEREDPRLHGGFTLYYMAVNLGSTVSLLIGPALSTRYGYTPAYFLSFLGLVFGLANYCWQRQAVAHIDSEIGERKIKWWLWAVVIAGIIIATLVAAFLIQRVKLAEKLLWFIVLTVVSIYFYLMQQENTISRRRMAVAFLLMLEAVIFFTLYQQMPTSLNLFAVNNVRPEMLGFSFDSQSFQALNPLWVILMSPVLALLYRRLHYYKIAFPVPHKFALGMILCGISFSSLYFARFAADSHGIISPWWLVVSYFFQSTGELLISALGVAMVAELVPTQIAGFVMGMWFLTTAVAGFIAAEVASFTALPNNLGAGAGSLLIYTQVFAYIGLVILAIGVLMWLIAAYLRKFVKLDYQ